jgi:hypothetical protein
LEGVDVMKVHVAIVLVFDSNNTEGLGTGGDFNKYINNCAEAYRSQIERIDKQLGPVICDSYVDDQYGTEE